MQQDRGAERANIPWESGTSTSDMGKKSINVSIYTHILCFCLLFLSPQELLQALKKKKKSRVKLTSLRWQFMLRLVTNLCNALTNSQRLFHVKQPWYKARSGGRTAGGDAALWGMFLIILFSLLMGQASPHLLVYVCSINIPTWARISLVSF